MATFSLHMETGSWETIFVSIEIIFALSASLWMMYRKVSRDVLILGGDQHTFVALSPLMQPRGRWTLSLLLVYRVCVVAFYAFVQLFDIHRTSGRCLVFYTSWNFILQGVYFALAATRTYNLYKQDATANAMGMGRDQPRGDYAILLDEDTGFLRRNTLGGTARRGWSRLDLVLDVCLATSILISAVVWTILLPYAEKIGHPEIILNWVSYCQHAVNLVLLQVDFVATRHSASLDALPLIVAWPTLYCVFTWIVHGTIKHGFWPYPFLKLDTPWAPVWYGGLLVAHVATLVGMLYLSKLKHTLEEIVFEDDESTGLAKSGAEIRVAEQDEPLADSYPPDWK